MVEKIFLFITFIGMVAGVSMFFTIDEKRNNLAFFVTCLINTFFSVLNFFSVQKNDYLGLIFSISIILFALSGIILRFIPIKEASFSPVIVFLTMILSIISIFKL